MTIISSGDDYLDELISGGFHHTTVGECTSANDNRFVIRGLQLCGEQKNVFHSSPIPLGASMKSPTLNRLKTRSMTLICLGLSVDRSRETQPCLLIRRLFRHLCAP